MPRADVLRRDAIPLRGSVIGIAVGIIVIISVLILLIILVVVVAAVIIVVIVVVIQIVVERVVTVYLNLRRDKDAARRAGYGQRDTCEG